jgi:excisionase family DNA binding protein
MAKTSKNYCYMKTQMYLVDEETLQKFAEKIVADTCMRMQVLLGTQDGEQYISRKTASQMLDVDESTIWRLVKKGKIKSYQIGGNTRYKRSEIEKIVEELS